MRSLRSRSRFRSVPVGTSLLRPRHPRARLPAALGPTGSLPPVAHPTLGLGENTALSGALSAPEGGANRETDNIPEQQRPGTRPPACRSRSGCLPKHQVGPAPCPVRLRPDLLTRIISPSLLCALSRSHLNTFLRQLTGPRETGPILSFRLIRFVRRNRSYLRRKQSHQRKGSRIIFCMENNTFPRFGRFFFATY